MSYTKDITIYCDEPNCTGLRPGYDYKSVQLTRRAIRADGWTYTVERGDRCAYHSKQETS